MTRRVPGEPQGLVAVDNEHFPASGQEGAGRRVIVRAETVQPGRPRNNVRLRVEDQHRRDPGHFDVSGRPDLQQGVDKVGYPDQFYFSRQFRAVAGSSPRHFRRRVGKDASLD